MTSYALAGAADDALLRALLRENVMPSWVTTSFEREPSWFAGAERAGREWSVLAREGGDAVGMYACCEQVVHFNGAPTELGYLSALRVRPAYRHKLRFLRDGYRSIRGFRLAQGPELWFTSIAAENRAARRLLEANVPGLPRYRLLNELVTLVVSTARGRNTASWRPAAPDEVPAVCEFHNARARELNLSPWLAPERFTRTRAPLFVAHSDGRLVACVAPWNQQDFRQVVIRGYRQPLRALRPLYNALARAGRRVPLPRVGAPLDVSALAFLAVAPEAEAQLEDLVAGALALCPTRAAMVALHAASPWLPRLQARFRPQVYRTRIYTVAFEDVQAADARPAQPDVALL